MLACKREVLSSVSGIPWTLASGGPLPRTWFAHYTMWQSSERHSISSPLGSAIRAAPSRTLYPGEGKAELAQTLPSLTPFAKTAIPANPALPGAELF